jgi:predicted ester cyclase
MSIKETALSFFDACETGKGWDVCQQYCHADASFSSQTDLFGETATIAAYTDSMAHLREPLPDMRYEMIAFGVDDERNAICAAATFHATHTGEGGPVPPTGKAVATEYCYIIQFAGDKISHMTKVWNDGFAMRQAGWA